MKVEKAQLQDAAELSRLLSLLLEEETPEETVKDLIEKLSIREEYALLAAKEDGKVLGTAMGLLCQDVCAGARKFLVIENVMVDERSRGKGAGRALMETLEAWGKAGGAYYAILVSGRKRQAGHAFYRALGFQEEKGFRKYF